MEKQVREDTFVVEAGRSGLKMNFEVVYCTWKDIVEIRSDSSGSGIKELRAYMGRFDLKMHDFLGTQNVVGRRTIE